MAILHGACVILNSRMVHFRTNVMKMEMVDERVLRDKVATEAALVVPMVTIEC